MNEILSVEERTKLWESLKPEEKQHNLLLGIANHNLQWFLKNYLGFMDMNGIHTELCSFLEQPIKFKLLLMPRYTFKSSICTIGYSLWRLAKNPDLRILIYSDAATKAQGFLSSIKDHISGNVKGSFFRTVFDWAPTDKFMKWNESQIVIKGRKTAYPEPSVDTAGIDTSLIGRHYDIIIFDDVVSDINTTTKEQMDKTANCYKRALSLLKPGGEILIVGTRWHFGDLYGRIIAENDTKGVFSIFIKPAIDENGKYLFDNIGTSSLTREFLQQQKLQQGSYTFSCNPYEAPILMADWKHKPIGEVKVGDEVIGWIRKENKNRLLKKSKVIATGSRKSHIVKIYLKSGRIIRCTPDHKWFTKRIDKTHQEYLPAKIGRKLMFVLDPFLHYAGTIPNTLQNDLAKWLGGFYDGEGSCAGGSVVFSQSHLVNAEVCEKLEFVLKTLGYNYNKTIRKPSRTAFGKETTNYWINGGLEAKRQFLLESNPAKREDIENIMFKTGSSRFIKEEDEVIDIKYDCEDAVYSLQTETGNYIVWGYASKNCLYQNQPTDPETAVFKVGDFAFYGAIKKDDLYITCTCDPAGKGEDFTAITIVGTDNNMDMHILDIINEHLQPSEIVDKIINFQYKYKFQILGVETNFFRGMLEAEIKRCRDIEHRENPDKFRLFGVHEFEASSRVGQGKVNRIMALQPYHERRAIKFPGEKFELLEGAFSDLAWQMIQFPNAAHDDILDSLAYHLSLIRPGGLVKKAELPYNSPAWLELQSYDKEIKHNMSLPRRLRQQIPNLAFS